MGDSLQGLREAVRNINRYGPVQRMFADAGESLGVGDPVKVVGVNTPTGPGTSRGYVAKSEVDDRQKYHGVVTAKDGNVLLVAPVFSHAEGFTGLVQGKPYYLQVDGTAGLMPTDYKAGVAISPTTLRVER